ncbi:deoxycytidylate deaminase isoform X2 [Frieseomelitta varia]|uniref:deoxycytidylate deaminase isoform X2 n=1 Tax=Frieseomelitta varia TaxID=561572 RepID=UPI001CB6B090|nr:deoxycytidylate deaminase isoform X2 [Frieseomelitta varia]
MASNEIAGKVSGSCITKQTSKRENYLDWDNYFMAMAFLSAKRSKDPVTQVGCSDDIFPWSKDSVDPLERKTFYVCHAEINAILNRNCYSLKNCIMYVSLFPCNECAKVIIQSGIKLIKYVSDKYAEKKKTQAAKRMFDAAGVKYSKYFPTYEKLIIDFTEIDSTESKEISNEDEIEMKLEKFSIA